MKQTSRPVRGRLESPSCLTCCLCEHQRVILTSTLLVREGAPMQAPRAWLDYLSKIGPWLLCNRWSFIVFMRKIVSYSIMWVYVVDTPASKPDLHHIYKFLTKESVQREREPLLMEWGDSETRHKIRAHKFKNVYFIPSQYSNPMK